MPGPESWTKSSRRPINKSRHPMRVRSRFRRGWSIDNTGCRGYCSFSHRWQWLPIGLQTEGHVVCRREKYLRYRRLRGAYQSLPGSGTRQEINSHRVHFPVPPPAFLYTGHPPLRRHGRLIIPWCFLCRGDSCDRPMHCGKAQRPIVLIKCSTPTRFTLDVVISNVSLNPPLLYGGHFSYCVIVGSSCLDFPLPCCSMLRDLPKERPCFCTLA